MINCQLRLHGFFLSSFDANNLHLRFFLSIIRLWLGVKDKEESFSHQFPCTQVSVYFFIYGNIYRNNYGLQFITSE
jgi:hypothetical protein